MKKNRTAKTGNEVKKGGNTLWTRYAVLGVVCALVIGVYSWSANSGMMELDAVYAKNTYYNLLAQGFSSGQLNLKTEVPPGLSKLADPYDLRTSAPYRWIYEHPLHDVSYYKGKLYLYFGITPALVLFWPYAVLTGHYLFHKEAAVIFFSIGFLAGAGLLLDAWRRYFADVSIWIIASCMIALGLANFTPAILGRTEVYEVAIGCGYAMTMLALFGIWGALHDTHRQRRWLAAASLAYGLAVGARPSLLFGAIILLIPVAQAWRENRRVWPLLVAAIIPIGLIGLGLMLYNDLRFDNPLDFGQRYQLPRWIPVAESHEFGLRYLWFNFRVAFLEPAHWGRHFPFIQDILLQPTLVDGGGQIEHSFGVLSNIPLVFLALAAPLIWRDRSVEARSTLRCFTGIVILLFGICALTICLHCSMCIRYEVEFAHTLVLLAVFGVIGLERTLASQTLWRRVVRCGWGLLLAFSVAFNLLESYEMRADIHINHGQFLIMHERTDEGISEFQKAIEVQPDNSKAHTFLGESLQEKGRMDEAIAPFQKALEIKPDAAETHAILGLALGQKGKMDEAIFHFQMALKINPKLADAEENLGIALAQKGMVDEAISHFQKSLEIRPDAAEAHLNLGNAYISKGKMVEAIAELKTALRLNPDNSQIQKQLADALHKAGKPSQE